MIQSQMVMKEKPRKSPRRPPTSATREVLQHIANFFLHNALSIPGVEYLLSFFSCSPSPGGEGHWEVRCPKTSRSLFCEQPIFVVLAGPNTVGQRVYNWKLLEAHFGKEQLILMVLFNCLALSNGGGSKPKTQENVVCSQPF